MNICIITILFLNMIIIDIYVVSLSGNEYIYYKIKKKESFHLYVVLKGRCYCLLTDVQPKHEEAKLTAWERTRSSGGFSLKSLAQSSKRSSIPLLPCRYAGPIRATPVLLALLHLLCGCRFSLPI